MDPERQKVIAAMGGRRAHEKGVGYEWTSEAARAAGKKGGLAAKEAKKGASKLEEEAKPEEKPGEAS